ncbi:MAG: MFS transporter, partial [Pseudomonadota bacterium]
MSINRLSPARLTAFSSLELSMAAFLTPLVVYIPPFYAGEMGLGLSTVGLIFGLTKLWDIVTDPIAGSITDKYGPVNGRRRFWLLLSLPIMLLGTWQIFLPPAGVGWLHFAFWMVFLYIGWTLLTISHISWGVELSDDYHERARIAAYRQAIALIGAAIVVILPVLSDQFGAGTDADRIASMGLFVMISLPILLAAVIVFTPSMPAKVEREAHSWKDSFTILRHNRSLRALLLGNMGILLGMAATGSTLLFYVEHVLRLEAWASFAVIPFLFSGLLY